MREVNKGNEVCGLERYRGLRWNNLTSPNYRHIALLLFWPLFGLLFVLAEKGGAFVHYNTIYCALDSSIPFCEAFIVPYILWFPYLAGMILYTLFYDVPGFVKMMKFIMFTYLTAMLVYVIYPNAQMLRPASFERDNIFTHLVAMIYQNDTNTNVCPSIHVMGSVAVWAAAWNCPRIRSRWLRAAFLVMSVLISLSTVFVKQHSAVDVAAAIPVCAAAWLLIYGIPRRKRKTETRGKTCR